jgi:phosphatidylinositol alpha-1,6-mannosyltransferase
MISVIFSNSSIGANNLDAELGKSCKLPLMAKISLVSRNFPPLTGGMERLVYELYKTLIQTHDVTLLGPKGCEDHVDSTVGIASTPVSPTLLFLLLTFIKGLFLHRSKQSPDVVIGGSGLVGPVVVVLAKVSGAKSILLLHGLDIIADSRLYQWLFVPFLRRADLVICNSKNTARLAMTRGVAEHRIEIVNPGAETQTHTVSHERARQTLDLANKKILLSVGRLIPRKGLPTYIREAFSKLAAADPYIILLVAGAEPASALNKSGGSVVAKINDAIAEFDLATQIRLLGHVSDDEIATLYAAADAFVFPLIETPGDVEGFGMVAIEAASHGTPTVAFDCGGVGDAVIDGENGLLVPPGDYASFNEATLKLLQQSSRDKARQFAAQFSWENYGTQFQVCVEKVMG